MNVKKINILFLGAGKLVTLLRSFLEVGDNLGISVKILSLEMDEFCPISRIAHTVVAPKFDSSEFQEFLLQFIKQHKINIVIPTMDNATVALSQFKKNHVLDGCKIVVSEHNLCKIMNDKILADQWFKEHDFLVPSYSSAFPKIAKPRQGYASKGIHILNNIEEGNNLVLDDYILQDFVNGIEYSVDAYVDQNSNIIDILMRKRIEVESGIVNKSKSFFDEEILDVSKKILSIKGWYGPITLQFIKPTSQKPILIEVNPRFGGGVTLSLHCGLNMPLWILQEYLGLPIEHVGFLWKKNVLMTRYREDVFYDDSN